MHSKLNIDCFLTRGHSLRVTPVKIRVVLLIFRHIIKRYSRFLQTFNFIKLNNTVLPGSSFRLVTNAKVKLTSKQPRILEDGFFSVLSPPKWQVICYWCAHAHAHIHYISHLAGINFKLSTSSCVEVISIILLLLFFIYIFHWIVTHCHRPRALQSHTTDGNQTW